MKKIIFIVFFFASIFEQAQTIGLKRTQANGTNKNAFTRILEPSIYRNRAFLNKTSTSVFTVSYDSNVPPADETAFNKAVDIWSHLIAANKEIKIRVEYVSFNSPSTLMQTDIVTWRNNFISPPFQNIQYPISLAKQLDNSIVYNGYDMIIKISNNQPWYTGLDGIPQEGKYDLISVALHEIAHGLGFGGTFNFSQGNGTFGYSGYPANNSSLPAIFDKYCISGSSRLINITDGNALGNLLQSDNVYFDGTNAKKANNNNKVKLYSPTVWSDGSSIFHLDESTFPAGNSNSLMTPDIDMAEVIHDPGQITLGILKDMGWDVNRFISFLNAAQNKNVLNILKGQSFTIKWYDNIENGSYMDIKLYKYFNGQFIEDRTVNSGSAIYSTNGNNTYVWNVPQTLGTNYYMFIAENSATQISWGSSKVFTISDKLNLPVFDPPDGHYNSPQNINITSGTEGATIRYTLNGSDPNENSFLFVPGSPFNISATRTIKAKAYYTLPSNVKISSDVAQAKYYINNTAQQLITFNTQYTSSVFRVNNGNGYGTDSQVKLGKEGQNVNRSYLKWDGLSNVFPAGTVIQSVEISISLIPFSSNSNVEFRELNSISNYENTRWDDIGKGTLYKSLPINANGKYLIENLVSRIQGIVNGTASGTLYVGLTNSDENNTSNYLYNQYNNAVLTIYYGDNVEVTQIDKSDDPFGQVERWQNNIWQSENVPFSFSQTTGHVTLKSSQNYKSGTKEKFYNWVNQNDYINFNSFPIASGINKFISKFKDSEEGIVIENNLENLNISANVTDKIEFADPWVNDEYVTNYKAYRNKGLNALPKKLESPIEIGNEPIYQGVFLGQSGPSQQWNPPYYTVKAESPQPVTINGKNHTFYFQNWEASPSGSATFQNANAAETPVVFNNAGATVKAVMKGSQLSNNANAFSNSGQRKVLTTQNGTMYLTYESMNSVWLEKSTDNGTTWQLMNNEKPLNSSTYSGKSPSMALDYIANSNHTHNNFYVVYEEYNGYSDHLNIAYFKDGSITPEFNNIIPHTTMDYFNNNSVEDLLPVISKTYASKILVVYKLSSAVTQNPGLYYYLGGHNNSDNPVPTDITWYGTPLQLGNTTNNSTNPAITVRKIFPKGPFHIAWQEGTTQIRYYELKLTVNNTIITPSGYKVISQGSSYSTNKSPTITMHSSQPQVSWIGTKTVIYGGGELRGKVQKTITYQKVIKRGKTQTGTWSYFVAFGDNATSSTSNNTYDDNYIIAWVEEPKTGLLINNFIINGLSNKIYTFGTREKYLQLSNGADSSKMYATTYSTKSLPYVFEQTTSIGSNLQKGGIIASGRQGVVYRENAEFYFAIGDVYLGRDLVEFTEVVDTTYVNDLVHLNSYLQTEAFDINNNSTVTYSVLYGLTDSTASAEILESGDNVNFKVELVDAQSGNVIGAYDDVTYTKNSLDNYNNIAYVINTEGVGNRTVKLRLVVNDNLNGGYGFSKIFGEETALGKFSNPVEQNYQGSMEVKQFALTQNYPNPFNPSTQIKYEIPKEGYVTLKVYDILGREVATLVNQKQSVGRYEATFDAGKLASGVYIYRLTVRSGLDGNFAASKKMILMK